MKLYPTQLDQEYHTDEGCYIIEILNTPDHPTSSIARARVPIGITTELHLLERTSEIYYIQAGIGIANIGGRQIKMQVGDTIVIPAGVPQQITNMGEEDLIFLCVCEPRFQLSNYKIVEA